MDVPIDVGSDLKDQVHLERISVVVQLIQVLQIYVLITVPSSSLCCIDLSEVIVTSSYAAATKKN